ncbi:hypothetical protein BGZ96_010383 [Linnemannia gamsii]|uniref:Uncharacterized protein n=1 Tax=Linnemannia gamsii TaxID=64522 RepID=A0ABQ7JVD2_9FUNG|nr:hypothetical protein BGZ96_010383 [Linnemannia gamsii]
MLTASTRLCTLALLVTSILSTTTTAAPSPQLGGPTAFSGTSGSYSSPYGGSQASVYAPNTLITTQANIHANTDIAPQVNVAPTIPIPYAELYSVPVPVASAYPYPVPTASMWFKKRSHDDCCDDDCCDDWDDCCCNDWWGKRRGHGGRRGNDCCEWDNCWC